MKIKISDIKPNPINDEIYTQTDLSTLKQSLELNGQLEPIVLNKDNLIVSGHRRYFSILQLGWEDVEVRYVDYDNDVIALIEHNQTRMKSTSDILNESRILEQEYRKQLGGQGKRTDVKGQKRFNVSIEIANKTGVGLSKLKQIKSIGNYEPKLIDKIDSGEMSVSKAYKYVQDKYISRNRKSPDEKLKIKLKNFIRNEDIDTNVLIDVLNDTYPFSLMNISTDDLEGLVEQRQELIDNMEFLKKLDNQEIVIYKKLKEVEHQKFKDKELQSVYDNIFHFSDINDTDKTIKEIENINPYVELVTDLREFNILRTLTSSMEWVSAPGRNLKYFVKDKSSKKYLGIITLASDVSRLTPRDKFIGWSRSNMFDDKKLNSTCIAQTIVSVQPMGYNLLGGKLCAVMCSDEQIRKDWKKKYKDELVGITTTSLYGGFSMYQNIPIWKKLGNTIGSILIKPDNEIYLKWLEWLRKNYRTEYDYASNKTSPKQNLIKILFRKLNIDQQKYQNEQEKGVYFLSLYNNTKEYLTNKIKSKDLVLSDKLNRQDLLDWWKTKSIKRYLKLHKSGKLKKQTLWYEDLDKKKVQGWLKTRGIDYL
tara:strand:- start:39 stop:1814 length:1776 start_codon:yes stop_codon:yes gene_type:complete